jgi:DNA-3-methyladenine glycosylase II
LERFGYPKERRHPCGFATLARALAGQQLSVKAAATIYARLLDHFDGELAETRLVKTRVATLRRLGLSVRKAESLRHLARARLDGNLQIDDFHRLPDQVVIEQISAIKGFGEWSAQMYLLFSLGRPDVWPAGDLGVRKGLQTVLELSECPDERQALTLGAAYAPERSSLALLCWHVKNNPTL